jgi:hypothetical protein
MRTHILVVLLSLLFVSLFAAASGAQAQDTAVPQLSIEEVVKLHDAGFAEDVIITKIRKNAKAFNLSTDELVDLRKAGISDTVVRFLLDPSQPYSPPPAAPPPSGPPATGPTPSPRQYPPDKNSAQIPAEPGLYWIVDDKPARIEPRLLLLSEAKGGFGKVLKGKGVAYLAGPAAASRTKEQRPIFYLRPPEGKGVEEFVLAQLVRKSDRRDLELVSSGKKQELNADAIRQFDSLEVGPRLFRLTPSKLAAGEYVFFQIGTGEPDKGTAGKGFDFGIDSAISEKKK